MVGRKRILLLMTEMRLAPIYHRPRTMVPNPEQRVFSYLPMLCGFLHLVAVMNWATRKLLAWRVSNTMEVEFCFEVLEEAMARCFDQVHRQGDRVATRLQRAQLAAQPPWDE